MLDIRRYFDHNPKVLALVVFNDEPKVVWPITKETQDCDTFVSEAIARHDILGERVLIYYEDGVTVGVPFLGARVN